MRRPKNPVGEVRQGLGCAALQVRVAPGKRWNAVRQWVGSQVIDWRDLDTEYDLYEHGDEPS